MVQERSPATRYQSAKLWMGLASTAIGATYLLAWLLTGASLWLRDLVAGWSGAWWVQAPIFLGILGGLETLLTFPLSYLRGHWLDRRHQLSHQTFGQWAWDQGKVLAVGTVLGVIVAEGFYALARTFPRAWWLAAALGAGGLAVLLTLLFPVVLLPFFFKSRPLADETLSTRLLTLARRIGVPVMGVFVVDMGRKSRAANAALVGSGPTRRILLSDTLVQGFPPDEIEVILAHELGHHRAKDLPKGIAIEIALILIGFFLADRLMGWGRQAFGFDGPADLAAAPFLLLLFGALGLTLLPLTHGLSRWREMAADRFALDHVRNPRAFISAMERLAELNLAERDPHPLKEFLFATHPAIGKRIALAQAEVDARPVEGFGAVRGGP